VSSATLRNRVEFNTQKYYGVRLFKDPHYRSTMSVTSQFLNSLRDTFLPENDTAQLKETAKHLGTAKKVFLTASAIFACLAIYWQSPLLFVYAYLSRESAMIFSNIQEIYNDVGTTISAIYSKANCEKQLFKGAPLFRLANWIIDPYSHTGERMRLFVLNQFSDIINN
jgi:hypothetical protein